MRTTVSLDRSTLLDLNEIRTGMSRLEPKTLTLGEVITRLIELWKRSQGAAQ